MLYLWEDTDAPESEVKFGDHWVNGDVSLDEAVADTRVYIRRSLGRQKHKFSDRNRITIHGIWDASKYAKEYDRFYPKSKVDDHMRHVIGHHIHADVHRIDPYIAKCKILQELGKVGQPLISAGLSLSQYQSTEEVIRAFRSGNRTVMAELCARFGKTVFAGAVAKELGDVKIVIIASYVLSSFSSFESDWRSFDQFREFEHVDTAEEDYKQKINGYLKNNKKVIVYLSMCNGSKRDERINYLFKKRHKKMLVVDEADVGVHREKQVDALIQARKPRDLVLLMTGTNADRAVSKWKIDYYVGVTYFELTVSKYVQETYNSNYLKHFEHCLSRDRLVVEVECYQLNLQEVVKTSSTEWCKDESDLDLFPSWSKFAKNPMRAKGFWVRMLESMFLGKHSIDEVNVDHQTFHSGSKVSMMFLPASITNENLRHAANIASEALPSFLVIPLCGSEGVTNKRAEKVANDAIETAGWENKSVLFLSANLAQRSFSVPQISDLFLAYDSGDAGSTIQKMSRALTSYKSLRKADKVGRIWSMSFDPNRDDKLDFDVLKSAQNLKQKNPELSIKDALRMVLQSVDIFECTENGAILVDVDRYLEHMCSRKSLGRIMGKCAVLEFLSDEDIEILAQGNTKYSQLPKLEVVHTGKTKNAITAPTTKQNRPESERDKDAENARKTITMIVENIDVILHGTNSETIAEALEKANKDKKIQESIEIAMGVKHSVIQHLFDKNIINADLLELLHTP